MSFFELIPPAFDRKNLLIRKENCFFTVTNSENCSRRQISQMILEKGFAPIISSINPLMQYVFTVVPYRLPEVFSSNTLSEKLAPILRAYNTSPNRVLSGRQHEPFILSFAQGLSGTALVVAAGENNIPLRELCQQFDQVVITDIDMQSMQERVSQLPADLQGKVKLVQQELTGIATYIVEEIERFRPGLSQSECMDRIISLFNEYLSNEPAVTFPGRHDFVVSSMVGGLLGLTLAQFLIPVLNKRFQPFVPDNTFQKALDDCQYVPKLCNYHLLNLHKWTKPNGRIYFGDAVYKASTHLLKLEHSPRDEVPVAMHLKEMISVEDVERILTDRFVEVQPRCQWNQTVVHARNEQKGFIFRVINYFLQPKENIVLTTPRSLEKIVPFFRQDNLLLRDEENSEFRSPFYFPHCELNKKNILSCATGLTGSALILAMGNENDIPLEEVCRQFDQVVITDVDLESMQECVQKLPVELQPKVKLFQHDLTGIAATVVDEIENSPLDVSPTDFFNRIISLAGSKFAKEPEVASPGRHNFVVSSMIAGSLGTYLGSLMNAFTFKRYFSKRGISIPEKLNASRFTSILAVLHLRNLHRWTLPHGRVYWSDAMFVADTVLVNDGTNQVSMPIGHHEILAVNDVEKILRQHFIPFKPRSEWHRELAPPAHRSKGKALYVFAHQLEPKSPIDLTND